MKRFSGFVCCIIALALLNSLWVASALAYKEKEILHIANCKDRISLRKSASTSSQRIAKIPLGAKVTSLSRK